MNNALKLIALILLAGCQSLSNHPPIRTEPFVDLQKFSGDWYVIASIPTFIEKHAYNAVESYGKPINGKVPTTFTFNKGSLDGAKKTYHPTGFVREGSGNAVWGMQFVWPIKAEYRIVYVDEEYSMTVVGRSKRDYVWLMARAPSIDAADYAMLVKLIADEGYDTSKLRRVPHDRR